MLKFAVVIWTWLSLASALDVLQMSIGRKSLETKHALVGSASVFSLAKHFQSHMVLQQAPQQASIYGFAPVSNIGDLVTAMVTYGGSVMNSSGTVTEGSDTAVWTVTFGPIKTNESTTVKVSLQNVSLVLEDVLFGDVWICSGQSNMQFMVQQMFGGEEEIANAHKYPNVRFMNVVRQSSSKPLNDLIGIDQSWASPLNTSIAHFSAVCWLYGKALSEELGYPIGLVGTNYGGTPVEAWSSPQALQKCGVPKVETRNYGEEVNKLLINGPQNNSELWNSMIYPMLGMTIYGAIWYQGEGDAQDPVMLNRYNCTFPAMIDDWRLSFNKASSGQSDILFPFGFVQLSTSGPNNEDATYVDIRWHQTADFGTVPNKRLQRVFMAVALDLPDFDAPSGPVHTRHKKQVGNRLFLSGLGVAYNRPVLFQGPFPVSGTLSSNNSLVLDYGDTWTLDIRNTEGFELLCTAALPYKTTWWVPTSILRYSKTRLELLTSVCGQGQLVRGLRYAWRTTPCSLETCAVYSLVNQLPAPPFTALADYLDGQPVFHF
ncbi:sialate O-acetylesterase-like isoform X2 [Physella acuta]|nr:sialate O-acetylesterase-like isoform X2 [Physella acuta]XP_059144150.1 sialate O-acetylesterase-like isoform X2 [Physella acuta]XP_059144151.1 sialate O-acetylesterase-like isoform X2 [Physella acuta]XP_059144152.1 sialate O-acetylesterase-like isoform X2 [Physella acuta]XP_059144153.1 sialate O-acetylesterase-like isoform X2 [Physella acuta]